MGTERDAATHAAIAARIGITPAQVRAVLEAPELGRATGADGGLAAGSTSSTGSPPAGGAGGLRPSAASTAPPAAATVPVAHDAPAGTPGEAPARAADPVPAAAAWASAGVALVAMFVFIATTGGFDTRPDGKVGALLTGLVFAGAALRAAVASRARRFLLGEQLGWTVVAIISPVITWSVLWLLDLWPGRWVQESAASSDGGYWSSGTDTQVAGASLMVFLTPLLVAVWTLQRTRAALAVLVALLAAHAVALSLAVLLGIPAPGAELATLLTGAYVAGFAYVGHRLEMRRPEWAAWVHPFALVAAFWFVGLAAQAFGSETGLLLGAALLVAGALLTVAYTGGTHLAATVLGGAMWDFWLYDELALGPVAGLALTLALGLGAIALGVAAWRGRRSAAAPGAT